MTRMKTLLALVTTLLIQCKVGAQENLYYQDFEGTDEEIRMAGWENVDLHGRLRLLFRHLRDQPLYR